MTNILSIEKLAERLQADPRKIREAADALGIEASTINDVPHYAESALEEIRAHLRGEPTTTKGPIMLRLPKVSIAGVVYRLGEPLCVNRPGPPAAPKPTREELLAERARVVKVLGAKERDSMIFGTPESLARRLSELDSQIAEAQEK